MASKKKRVVEPEMKDLEVDGKNELLGTEEEENMDTEEVQVDFEARNPEDCDFHGIKKLLQQLFLKANINLSELTDTLISQNYVGSVLLQAYNPEEDDDDSDDDMDVFGIVSVMNITERQKLESVKQLKTYLEEKCEECSKQQKEQLSQLLHDPNKQVGFLISERFINIPPQISLPSFQSLWKEVERAKKKMKYDFTDYIMICKTLRMPTIGKKQKGKSDPNNQGQRVFVNSEEELFFEESAFHFDFSVKAERDTAVGGTWDTEDEDLEPFRTVLVISVDKMDAIMTKLIENLSMT